MIVSRLSFLNYRNLCEGEFLPDSHMNVIFGQNAQGKTNLLEALWLFTGGRSFRGSRDHELIAFGQETAKLSLSFFSEEREQKAVLTIQNKKRSASINGVDYGGVMELVGKCRAVVFSPEHLSLVKDGPALRRSFLDGALCQLRPVYTKLLFQYNRVLQQRNALLKDIPRHGELLDTLEIWDEKLSQRGARIIMERGEYIRLLSQPAQAFYEGISGAKEQFSISYRTVNGEQPISEDQWREHLFRLLGSNRKEDISAGFTTVGPHRDDLEIQVNERLARSFGSQGQQRSCVLALKLAEAEVLQSVSGEAPVILLDDVLSELDSGRQDFLLNQLGEKQVFLTCCDPEIAARYSGGGRFEMEQGQLSVQQ